MATTREPLVTAEELGTPAYADRIVELVDGRVVEMSPAFCDHGDLVARILEALVAWNLAYRLGVVLTAETGFVLKRNPDTLRAPDVCFVRKERWAAAKKFFEGAPDVVVEVLSASNRPKDIARKVRDYLGAGAQQVWLVDPDSKTIDVHTQADCRTLTAQDVLDGGAALPGFKLDLAVLFAP
jgi:Uma2 family endonuclease